MTFNIVDSLTGEVVSTATSIAGADHEVAFLTTARRRPFHWTVVNPLVLD